jgi:competence protein ComEA
MEIPRAHLGWYAAAAVLLVLVGFRLVGGRAPAAAPVRVGAGTASASSSSHERHDAERVVVHVAGAVRRPGVYPLPVPSRAADAVEAAGGLLRRADATGVNLAAPLSDGQQVIVPARVRGAPVATGASGPGGADAASGTPISLSTATIEQLDTLDGIGPAIAQRIVSYREAHHGFKSVEELREVEGVGDKRFEALRKAVRP